MAMFRQTFSLLKKQKKNAKAGSSRPHDRGTIGRGRGTNNHQPLDQIIKCVPTAKSAEPTIRAVAEICRDLWGSHHHASRSQMPI
ncbi:unnamed protein product [Prunus brigantina]